MAGIIIDLTATGKNKNIKNAISAHSRNAIIISELMNYKLVTSDVFESVYKNKKFDVVVFDYASQRMPINAINEFLDKNKDAKIVWIVNDYKESMPSFLLKKDIYVISNNDHIVRRKNIIKHLNVNLNCLATDIKRISTEKIYDFIYYGTFRKDRLNYLKRYINSDIFLSTSKKNKFKFQSEGINAKFIDKLKWTKNKETLRLFRYSIIVEDKKSHFIYSHAPNRLYESILCGCIPLIDINMKKNIEKSDIYIPDICYIKSIDDIKKAKTAIDDSIADHIYEKNIVTINQQKELAKQVILNFLIDL